MQKLLRKAEVNKIVNNRRMKPDSKIVDISHIYMNLKSIRSSPKTLEIKALTQRSLKRSASEIKVGEFKSGGLLT